MGHAKMSSSVMLGTTALIGVAAFAVGLFVGSSESHSAGGSAGGKAHGKKRSSQDPAAGPKGECKMVLCVRMDLKMGKGKIAAQCCHATLGVFKKLWRKRDPVLRQWEDCGQPKVTLQVPDEQAMLELYARAKEAGVPTYIVVDAGRTQVAPNSRTVMAVGPAPVADVNTVTGGLKLL